MILGVPEIFDEVSRILILTRLKLETLEHNNPESNTKFLYKELDSIEMIIDSLNEIGKLSTERDEGRNETLEQLNLRLTEITRVVIDSILRFIDINSNKENNGK